MNYVCCSDCYADSEVRMRALQMMLHLCTEKKNQHFASQLVEALIEKDKIESSSKSRYYNDSHLHRIKHRILQNLLILEPLLGSVSIEVRMEQMFQHDLFQLQRNRESLQNYENFLFHDFSNEINYLIL